MAEHRQARNEEKVYQHLKEVRSDHHGKSGIPSLKHRFQIGGKFGLHECLIHEQLGLTLKDIREMSEGEKVSTELLKPIIKYLLMALDYLHSDAKVVHTGE